MILIEKDQRRCMTSTLSQRLNNQSVAVGPNKDDRERQIFLEMAERLDGSRL
jgi:hypothetical protein